MIEILKIDANLPTLNEYIDLERSSRYGAATLKKNATNKVCLFANRMQKLPEKLFDIEIHWIRTNNKHDADNVFFGVKFILDGIVKAGKLKSDGRKHIRNISHKIETSKETETNFCIVKFIETC